MGRLWRPPGRCRMLDKLHELYEAAGVATHEDLWHCLRYTYGTELASAGVDARIIRELMGHAGLATTQRFLTVFEGPSSGPLATVPQKAGHHMANTESRDLGSLRLSGLRR